MSKFVKSIKETELMETKYECKKLIKGDAKFVVSNSYIVMIKQNVEISGVVSSKLTLYISSISVTNLFAPTLDAYYCFSIR